MANLHSLDAAHRRRLAKPIATARRRWRRRRPPRGSALCGGRHGQLGPAVFGEKKGKKKKGKKKLDDDPSADQPAAFGGTSGTADPSIDMLPAAARRSQSKWSESGATR